MTRTIVAMLLALAAGACAGSQTNEPVRPMEAGRSDDGCAEYRQRPGTDKERTAQDMPEECWPVLNEPSITFSESTYTPQPTGERTGEVMPANAVAQPVGKAPQ